MSFGDRLRRERNARGWTTLQLAERSGVPNSTISRYETGDRTRPRAGQVVKLAQALDVHERWLLTGEGPKTLPPPSSGTHAHALGLSGLEELLSGSDIWPAGLLTSEIDSIVAVLRAEAKTEIGRTRPISVWRHRVDELVRGRRAG